MRSDQAFGNPVRVEETENMVKAHEATYKELANALRRVVHLDSLDHLLLLPSGGAELSMQRSARSEPQSDQS